MTTQLPGDIQFNDNIPSYEQKAVELRAFLFDLAENTSPLIARIQVESDSIYDYKRLIAEIALYREGLRNVNTFYISEGLLLKDALSGYSLEQLVDYVQAHIQRMEQDLENLDLLINQEVSRMSIRLYVTDKPDAVDIINQVLQKIRALNGTVTRAEYGNFMPEVMHNPFFIDVKLK